MGERKAIIFSTHILEEVEAACSRAIIIDRGQIVANGTPQRIEGQIRNGGNRPAHRRAAWPAPQVVERLSALPGARKTTIVKEEKGKVCARVYPKAATQNGELARQVLAAGAGWQLEEVRTDEGRLDEVFRSITLPDTDQGGREMNSFANIKTIAKRELSGYFGSPVAYVFIVIFLLLTGFFTFSRPGGFFERGQASLEGPFFMWHPWLYLFLVPGGGDAPVGGGTPRRHARIVIDNARHRLAGHRGQIPRLLALSRPGPVPDLPGRHHRQLSRLARQRRHFHRLRRQLPHGRRLSGHQLHDLRHDPQPGRQLHRLGRHLPVPRPVRISARSSNLLTRLDKPWLVNLVASFSVMTHFNSFSKGLFDSRDVIFFLSVIGFSLFTTGVILRSHRSG